MVEAHTLLIGPWTRETEGDPPIPGAWVRRVHDGETGKPLGFAAWTHARAGFLSRWFGARTITLNETEDASLVMTLRRGFWRRWEVFDAEEFSVGMLIHAALLDAAGAVLAYSRKPRSPEGGGFLDARKQTLARFCPAEDGWLLTFAHHPNTTPFTRMVLLARVLTWGPEPD